MNSGHFDYFTKPTALEYLVTCENGQVNWPNEVRKLAQLIPNGLFAWMIYGPHISIPEELLYLIEELKVNVSQVDRDTDTKHYDLVHRILPFAMWICHQYRCNLHSPPNHFLFHELLQSIVNASMPEFRVQECVDYAMPRGPTARMNFFPGLCPTSRQAPFVVLFDVCSFKDSLNSIPPFDMKQHNLQLATDISDSRDRGGQNYASDPGSFIGSGVEQESNNEGINSSDTHETPDRNMQEAYLLTDQKVGEAPGITIFCAGPSEDLEPLMLSTLYHRLAWGVRDPLLGFAWDRTSTFVSAIFGWIEQCSNENNCLPRVHLTHTERDSATGRFNMADPWCVVQLITFLGNFREIAMEIVQSLEESVPQVVGSIANNCLLQWRADNAPRSIKEDQLTRDELLSRWMKNLNWPNAVVDALPIPYFTRSTYKEEDTQIINESPSERIQKTSKWGRSRSYFVGEKTWRDNMIDFEWLQNRRAFGVYLSEEDLFPSKEFRETYIRYTKLYNPPCEDWADPTVFSALGLDLSEFLGSLVESLNANYSGENLENDVWDHVQQAMRLIATQSVSSKSKMEYQKNHPFSRSDCRTEWNNLTYALFHGGSGRQYGLRTEFDQSIKLPRNTAGDTLLEGIKTKMWKKWIRFRVFLFAHHKASFSCILQFTQRGRTVDSERIAEAEIRHDAAINRVSYYDDHNIHGRQLSTALRLDPTEVRADCLGVVTSYHMDESNRRRKTKDDNRVQDNDVLTSQFARSANILCSIKGGSVPNTSLNVDIVVFFQEYTKPSAFYGWEVPSTSFNHLKMDLVAGVTHLASLGVVEFPLFGVSTANGIASVLCAWCGPMELHDGEMQNCIYIVDKDVVQYDLSTPIGAYNYATFLSMLVKRHVPQLVARLNDVRDSGPEYQGKDWKEMDWIRSDWTMKEQIGLFQDQGLLDHVDSRQ